MRALQYGVEQQRFFSVRQRGLEVAQPQTRLGQVTRRLHATLRVHAPKVHRPRAVGLVLEHITDRDRERRTQPFAPQLHRRARGPAKQLVELVNVETRAADVESVPAHLRGNQTPLRTETRAHHRHIRLQGSVPATLRGNASPHTNSAISSFGTIRPR